MNAEETGGSDGNIGVRRRLIASFTRALAIGFAAGAVCAVIHLLQNRAPTIFFSPARYLFLTTVVCLCFAAIAAVIGIPLMGIALFSWRRHGRSCEPLWLAGVLIFLGVYTSYLTKTLPLIGKLSVAQQVLFEGGLGLGLAWFLVRLLIRSRAVQLAAFPLLGLTFLAKLAGLGPGTAAIVGGVIVAALRRYQDDIDVSFTDTIATLIAVAIPLAAFVYIRVGHFVLPLDMPYTVAYAGLLGLVVAIVLIARNASYGRHISRQLVAALVLSAITAGGAIWAQYPPDSRKQVIRAAKRPSIVLIVWDSARARQLAAYGYERATTPNFDNLAGNGVLFERVTATSCWTLPTHGSIFTGLWPRTHAASNGGYHKLRAEEKTIAELLSAAGYETVGLTANHLYAGSRSALDQGFDHFYEPGRSAERDGTPMATLFELFYPYDDRSMDVQRALRRWLFTRSTPDRPFFLFVNLYEPHTPYWAPPDLMQMSTDISPAEARKWGTTESIRYNNVVGPGGPERREQLWQALGDIYDGEMRYADRVTADMLDMLAAASSKGSQTLTVVTSDHGESLGEHDRADHQFAAYETLLHVPMVMTWPGRFLEGQRIGGRVSQRDLFATIADAAQLPRTTWAEKGCQSLLPSCTTGGSRGRTEPVFAEVWPLTELAFLIAVEYFPGTPRGRFMSPLIATYDGPYKYITARTQNKHVLYNLAEDPHELHDISERHPRQCDKMAKMIDHWLSRTPNNMPTFANGYERQPLEQ